MKKIRKFNIIDLEGTCWQDQKTPDGKSQRHNTEIIEIGICQIDVLNLEIVKKQSYLVKPVLYPILTDYCQELTGITNEMIESGITLKYATKKMMSEFKTKKYEWGSFGDYDRNQFKYECEKRNIEYPLHNTHINLKYLISVMTGTKVQRNLNGMLDFFHMNFIGQSHRGIDDAYNLSCLYLELLKEIRENTIKKNVIDRQGWGDQFYWNNSVI